MPAARATEFVIISAPEVNAYLLKVRARLHRHLAGSFPHFRFSLVEQAGEGDDMGFVVVPVVGKTGAGPLAEIDHDILRKIRSALEDFDPAQPEQMN